MRQTIENTIIYRIMGTGGGWAFSPSDFLDIGGRSTVDSVLHRLKVDRGLINCQQIRGNDLSEQAREMIEVALQQAAR